MDGVGRDHSEVTERSNWHEGILISDFIEFLMVTHERTRNREWFFAFTYTL